MRVTARRVLLLGWLTLSGVVVWQVTHSLAPDDAPSTAAMVGAEIGKGRLILDVPRTESIRQPTPGGSVPVAQITPAEQRVKDVDLTMRHDISCLQGERRETVRLTPANLNDFEFIREYGRLNRAFQEGKLRRAVVYTADGTGWGNRRRATVTALLLAVLTERAFFVQDFQFTNHFGNPLGLNWTIGALKPARLLNPHANSKDRQAVQTANLSIAFPEALWVHHKGNSFHIFLARNPHYVTRFKVLFESRSMFERIVLLNDFLMMAPLDEAAAQQHAAIKYQTGSPYWPYVGIHLRTNFDDKASWRKIVKHLPHTWNCIVRFCAQAAARAHAAGLNASFFFATDDPSVRAHARERLGVLGTVEIYDKPVVHSSKLVERKGKVSSAPPAWLVDLLYLRRSEIFINTGSSFAISAVRRGQTVVYAGRAGERDGCHCMPNTRFPSDYDDRMENRTFERILTHVSGLKWDTKGTDSDNIRASVENLHTHR